LPEKIVFLDRDGVINYKAREHEYIISWDDFQFLPGVPEAIRKMNEAGYKIAVVTNQRGVALGRIAQDHLEYLHDKMCEELSRQHACVSWVFYCPHDYGECDCRKPKAGLLRKVEQFVNVDKPASWMIGDSFADIQAGNAYGVNTIFIGELHDVATYSCTDLLDAATLITKVGYRCKF
jgi:histidinol-phosphate phosphatase family protein